MRTNEDSYEVALPGLNFFQKRLMQWRWRWLAVSIGSIVMVAVIVELFAFFMLAVIEWLDASDPETEVRWELPNAWWSVLLLPPVALLLGALFSWFARWCVVSVSPVGGLDSTLSDLIDLADSLKEEEGIAQGLAAGAVVAVKRLPHKDALKAVKKRYDLLRELSQELYLRRLADVSSEDVMVAQNAVEGLRLAREAREEFR